MINSSLKSSWRSYLVYASASAIVTLLIFSYLLQHVSLAEVIRLITNTDARALLAFVLLSLTASVCRTWRYSIMLRLCGENPNSAGLFLTVIIRNLFSDLLPARVGSFIYVLIITGRLGIQLNPALSSFTLAFFFDLLALVPMIIVAAFWAGVGSQIPPLLFISGALAILLGAAASLLYLPAILRGAARELAKLKREQGSFWQRVADKISNLAHEFELVRDLDVSLRLFILSFLVLEYTRVPGPWYLKVWALLTILPSLPAFRIISLPRFTAMAWE